MVDDPVIIRPYDPSWPALFEEEAARLRALFQGVELTVEHVGSTAVPGLAAKPVIDMMPGVAALAEVERRVAAIEALDYEYVPEFEAMMPDRRYFRRPRGGVRTHHLHFVVTGGEFWRSHLAFRDHLRAHPEVAEAYAALKLRLAVEYRDDRSGYTDAKSDFIRGVLEQ